MSSFQNTQIALASVFAVECSSEGFVVPDNCADALSDWCLKKNIKPVIIADCLHGAIMAFPSAVWSAVFGVDLDVLFNGETA